MVYVQVRYISFWHPCLQVSEEEIVAAMRLIYERMKVVVEPSGAVGLAAALSPQLTAGLGKDVRLQRVGVVLSGGNVDLAAKGFWRAWLPPAET